MSVTVCMSCHRKQVRINELEDELVRLKHKLRYQERTAKEGPFKSSTPSSKVPVKANSLADRQAKTGGGTAGHEGHGRSSLTAAAADRDELVSVEPLCPHCLGATASKGSKDRTVIDYDRGRMSNTLYHLESRRCPRCRKVYTARPSGVFARSRYGNGLLAQVAVEHYVHGRTLGQLEQQLGVGYGALVQAILAVRVRYGWGARKIRAYLLARSVSVPSIRTVTAVLQRHDQITDRVADAGPLQRFERSRSNDLWQLDFKGRIEVARRRVHPFSVLDDHSRYCLALRACGDLRMATAWKILWEVFGQVGLPEAILSDNAFGTRGVFSPGISWFESMLIRVGIAPIHGRPYHPQTQGKVERFHGTLERELWPNICRNDRDRFAVGLDEWRLVYNMIRPHEAIGDRPPVSRWLPGERKRPETLPEVTYPAGSVVRKVGQVGDVRWNAYRILVGRGLTGQFVRIEERDHDVAMHYAWKQIRCLAKCELKRDTML